METRPADAWALQTLRRLWADFMAGEPGTLRGEDPEQLHRMRVALRRLRTAIALFAQVLPSDLVACDGELRWIARQLGDVRDLDVQRETMAEAIQKLDADQAAITALDTAAEEQRKRARKRLLDALTGSRFENLVLRIARTLREQIATSPVEGATIGRFAPAMLEGRYLKLRKIARGLTPKSPSGKYHAVRRRARRLRFAVEFVEPLYGEQAHELIGALTELQDILGVHQDCYAAIELRRRAARSLGPDGKALIRALDQHDLERAAALRKSAPDSMRRVRRRWKDLKPSISA